MDGSQSRIGHNLKGYVQLQLVKLELLIDFKRYGIIGVYPLIRCLLLQFRIDKTNNGK